MGNLRVLSTPPMLTVQDSGRSACLHMGICSSGPMDRGAFAKGAALLDLAAPMALEMAGGRLVFTVSEQLRFAATGGEFILEIDGQAHDWHAAHALKSGSVVSVSPGSSGNFAYLRFSRAFDLPRVLGSYSTNLVAALGGNKGATIGEGAILPFSDELAQATEVPVHNSPSQVEPNAPFRFVWGIHSALFPEETREEFCRSDFTLSPQINRMGMRLIDENTVFSGLNKLSLVSDSVVPGDVQILGDGTPVILMRDHQPTGGYPRIATIISADLDRLAQTRPGTTLRFEPVSVEHAHRLRSGRQ